MFPMQKKASLFFFSIFCIAIVFLADFGWVCVCILVRNAWVFSQFFVLFSNFIALA